MAVRVLIVEDDQVTAHSLQHRLERIGCEIVGMASDSAHGLALFREHKPDLVTLDINLDDPDGNDSLRLYETIRAENPDCEIAVISGSGFVRHREIFRRGVVGFYSKPIDFELIARTLRKYFPELKPFKPDRAF